MTEIVRGATLVFSFTFRDLEGVPTTPDSAKLYVNYKTATSSRATVEIVLVNNSGAWAAEWESTPAYPGRVLWSVRTAGEPQVISEDGFFELVANAANPNPAS